MKILNYSRVLLLTSFAMRFTVLIAGITAGLNGRWMVVFVSGLALLLSFLPSMLSRKFKTTLPTEFEFALLLFIYLSLFLGEIHDYYTKFWWWDVVLHASSGITLGFLGFITLYFLYDANKLKAKPITLCFFSFCFAVAIGTVWEIAEFFLDSTFGLNMQKSGLVDTMWDLIVDALGAIFTSTVGFIYLKGGKTRIFEHFLKRFHAE